MPIIFADKFGPKSELKFGTVVNIFKPTKNCVTAGVVVFVSEIPKLTV